MPWSCDLEGGYDTSHACCHHEQYGMQCHALTCMWNGKRSPILSGLHCQQVHLMWDCRPH